MIGKDSEMKSHLHSVMFCPDGRIYFEDYGGEHLSAYSNPETFLEMLLEDESINLNDVKFYVHVPQKEIEMTLFELAHELLVSGMGLCKEQFDTLYTFIEKQEDTLDRESALQLMRDADAVDDMFYLVPECDSISIPDEE
jgi:hypothetical protein